MLKNKTILTAIAVFASLLFCAGASAQDSPRKYMQKLYSQPGVAESFTPGCLGKKYPAYSDRAGWAKLLGKDMTAQIIENGESYLDYIWQHIPAPVYLEFNRSGNRTNMERPHSQNRAALAALLFAELAEGKGRFIQKIADGMYYFAFMPAWIIAAHNHYKPGNGPLPSGDDFFIDLFDGEVGSVISWCLYYIEDEVDKLDPVICRAVRRALDNNIITPFLDPAQETAQWWMGFDGGFVNNWNPWCNYNAMQAFLLVEKDQAKINEAVARSIKSIDIYIDQFNDDGACDEGPGYFDRAAGMLYNWIQEMYDASGGKFNAFGNDKIRRMGEFESRADMGGGYMANFADAAAKLRPDGSLLWNYGKAFDSQELVDYGLFCLRNDNGGFDKPKVVAESNVGRALERIWNASKIGSDVDAVNARVASEGYDKVLASLRKSVPANTWYPQTEVAFLHTSDWNIAAKGGNNGESHNHNDIGNFILSSNDHPVLIDVGAPTYTRQTFSDERYGIFTMQSGWHNVPIINGTEQKDGEEFAASNTSFKTKGATSTLSMDLKGAYLPEAACNSWVRTFTVTDGKKGSVMTITDTYSLSSRKAADEERFMTAGEVYLPGDVFDGTAVAEGKVLVHDGNTVLEIAYPKTLTPSVEEKELDDPKISNVWGPKISRIVLRSAPNAPVKGTYKMTITQK